MENSRPVSNKNQFSSFVNAFRGIYASICESSHLKFHLLAAGVVVVAGFVLGVSGFEWLILILIMSAVISAEIINTAIEDIENVIRDQAGVDYAFTGKGKDMAAGAVLVFAIAAVIIAILIFYPKVLALL